tara:strand:+ start:1111 stop:1278 length:168 start_codon:yes stop_codon:yes gene_type:complete
MQQENKKVSDELNNNNWKEELIFWIPMSIGIILLISLIILVIIGIIGIISGLSLG